jgi:hypothetical protein
MSKGGAMKKTKYMSKGGAVTKRKKQVVWLEMVTNL